MRAIYLWAGLAVALLVIFNLPRAPFIEWQQGDPIGILKGLKHGMIGFSYMAGWGLFIGGIYQIILGVLYWDMDTMEQTRLQFNLDSGGTAKVLWVTGALCLIGGLLLGLYAYRNDNYLLNPPCGVMSTLGALLACWLMWLAFPLYDQVGIDREELGV